MKEKNTVHYSRRNVHKGKTNWDRLQNLTEDEIERGASADHDNPRWTKKMLKSAQLKKVN